VKCLAKASQTTTESYTGAAPKATWSALDKRVVVGRVVGLDQGGVGGRGAAPFSERGTTPINRIQKIVGLGPGTTIFAPVFG
jgi:hypothetical protein